MTISSVTDFKDAEVTTRIVNQNNNLHYYSDFSSLFLYNNRRSIIAWAYYFIKGCKVVIFLILLCLPHTLEIISKKKLSLHEKLFK